MQLLTASDKFPVWGSWKELNSQFEKRDLKCALSGNSGGLPVFLFRCMCVSALLLGEAWESGDVGEERLML